MFDFMDWFFDNGIPILLYLFVALLLVAIYKCFKLNVYLRLVRNNPCQETAEKLLQQLRKMRWFYNIRLNGVQFMPYSLMRNVFNHHINHSPIIPTELKAAIWDSMDQLRVHSLDRVMHVQSAEEAKAAARAFGSGGEDNVWHNLKSLPDLGGYDVYRTVRLACMANNNEIDAVVVAENGGVFLLEVKSLGGKRNDKGIKVVSYSDLDSDPNNQMMRHRAAFTNTFAELNLTNQQVMDVLVFSYPHGDEKRIVDYTSFPKGGYAVVSVDVLLRGLSNYNKAQLTMEQRQAIAKKLITCCGDYIVTCMEVPKPSKVEMLEQGMHFCTSCGQKITTGGTFCPHCGNKLNG